MCLELTSVFLKKQLLLSTGTPQILLTDGLCVNVCNEIACLLKTRLEECVPGVNRASRIVSRRNCSLSAAACSTYSSYILTECTKGFLPHSLIENSDKCRSQRD